jgi:hypothetical protein
MGSGSKSYINKPPHIWLNICAFYHILGSTTSYMSYTRSHLNSSYMRKIFFSLLSVWVRTFKRSLRSRIRMKKGLNLSKNWMLYWIFGKKSETFGLMSVFLHGDFDLYRIHIKTFQIRTMVFYHALEGAVSREVHFRFHNESSSLGPLIYTGIIS